LILFVLSLTLADYVYAASENIYNPVNIRSSAKRYYSRATDYIPVYSKSSKIEFVPTKSIIPDTDYRVVVALETSGVDTLTKGSYILWGLLGEPDVFYEGIIKIRVTAYPRKDKLPSIVMRGKGEVSRLVKGKSGSLVHYKSANITDK